MSYTLRYLPLRARAEPIRMLLHYAQIPFTDEIIPFHEWPSKKIDSSIAPFAQLPSLTLPNGLVLAESATIIRFLAKIAHLYPEDPVEAAKADMLFDLVLDLNAINPIMNWFNINDEGYAEKSEAFFTRFSEVLQYLHQELGSKSFFGGDQPHQGDFGIFHIFSLAISIKPTVFDSYPRLKDYVRHFAAIPTIKQYLDTRPRAEANGLDGSYIKVHKKEFDL